MWQGSSGGAIAGERGVSIQTKRGLSCPVLLSLSLPLPSIHFQSSRVPPLVAPFVIRRTGCVQLLVLVVLELVLVVLVVLVLVLVVLVLVLVPESRGGAIDGVQAGSASRDEGAMSSPRLGLGLRHAVLVLVLVVVLHRQLLALPRLPVHTVRRLTSEW